MANPPFIVEYQPHLCFSTGYLSGFEALVRWEHPTHGRISPANFIPIAEETGLIIPLGAWVLKTACCQLKSWQDTFPRFKSPLIIAVNFSGKQLLQPNIVGEVAHILKKTGLAASCLRLEITESVLINNLTVAKTRLKELSQLGIQLAIDDFGTGYSSLARLREFEVDVLKIDQSFIHQMQALDENTEFIKAIIELGHSLNMSINAEGIETPSQLSNLKKLGCDEGQGLLFSRSLPPHPAEKLIAESVRGNSHLTKLLTTA
ncbi:cyclic diguanylate phosphodiesterase (EAL) domain, putative [Synechococcus sp. PCC 7335]|uniref:putative bifunctional diguanylate cyclase/phosphodiesterase n=1 Tax=Synechococcus sp. (strain ATCC 29403 / PCC 7335) TaxID=91464 RepID=UPI00017EE048|nr:EAL domain-containing protein [Synechococcus sp. PCC 7335]EDX85666.1 cyclic diguanylate phosphodiesterase (EAL) domain, putative [Synechococcus sp. PCC 7335]